MSTLAPRLGPAGAPVPVDDEALRANEGLSRGSAPRGAVCSGVAPRSLPPRWSHDKYREEPFSDGQEEHPTDRVQGRFGGEQGALEQEEHEDREVGGGERALAGAEAQVDRR